MKILWVKGGKLLPVDTGGKIRSINILRQLAVRHELTLLSYYGGQRDEAYESEIARQFPGAVTVHTAAPDSNILRQALDYALNIPSPAPYAVTKFTSSKVKRLLKGWLAERREAGLPFDVAVCDFLSASLNFPSALHTPTVLFQHNVESILWQRQSLHEPDLFKRTAFKLEAAKMTRYERAAVGRFHHVIAVSEHDRQLMSEMTDPSRISVVPTGVDLQKYRPGPSATAPLVIFTGSMDWEANIDGCDYFCREVWPSVRERVPGVHLRIVGRNPHPRVKKLAGEDIEVTGTVPSVTEHLREAAVVVVPLRIGGGTRLKIYEAMAMGKAVVSTSIGAEGLDVNHKSDILIADEAGEFARSVITLLTDEQLRQRIEGEAARQAAAYDWPVIADRFEEVLARVRVSAEAMSDIAPVAVRI